MENNLPDGWVETTLDFVCSIDTGKWDANHACIEGKYRFYTCAFEHQFSDTKRFSGECIILPGNGANVGEVFYYNGEFDAYQRTYVLSNLKLNTKYVFYHMQFLWKEVNKDKQYGSATNYIKIGNFHDYLIQIPPLPEQHRIVAKLDAIFEKIESNKQRLEKIPKILKRFRQSVLAAAISGKLTENWRIKNGVVDEWKEVELNSIIPKGGIFDGPFGSNLKTADYTEIGVRVIRLENIEHLFFVKEKETYITEEKYQTLLRHSVGEGDIIFSSFIADEIRACILPKLETTAIAKADCFCIRPDKNKVDKWFLLYSLVSMTSHQQLVVNIHGATRPRINTTQLKALQILLPKLEEQQEIVRRVEQLFAFGDRLEARYNKAKAMLEKLPQSILAKAFRGELVPQDLNDEPASILLERIASSKLKSKVNGKRVNGA